jgi:hypothetical protein
MLLIKHSWLLVSYHANILRYRHPSGLLTKEITHKLERKYCTSERATRSHLLGIANVHRLPDHHSLAVVARYAPPWIPLTDHHRLEVHVVCSHLQTPVSFEASPVQQCLFSTYSTAALLWGSQRLHREAAARLLKCRLLDEIVVGKSAEPSVHLDQEWHEGRYDCCYQAVCHLALRPGYEYDAVEERV